jgi:hypothetical protein
MDGVLRSMGSTADDAVCAGTAGIVHQRPDNVSN